MIDFIVFGDANAFYAPDIKKDPIDTSKCTVPFAYGTRPIPESYLHESTFTNEMFIDSTPPVVPFACVSNTPVSDLHCNSSVFKFKTAENLIFFIGTPMHWCQRHS